MKTPSTLWIWLSEQAQPLALTALLLLLIIAVLSFSARRRRVVMNQARADVNESTFVNYLTSYGFDANIARTTYAYLQEKQGVAFPLAASDLLDEDLGLDSSEVQETIRDLMQINARLFQPGVITSPVLTVEDLIRVLQASPRLSELAA